MANTTNLNLSKLAGTEKLKSFPSPYNDNMDAIDGAFGADFGVSGKPSVNAELNSLGDGLAIIANGNTHAAITSGQFVYVRGHGTLADGLYVATSNISANATLSGSNLTADTAGGLNTVYSSLNSKITPLAPDNSKTLISFNAQQAHTIDLGVTPSSEKNVSVLLMVANQGILSEISCTGNGAVKTDFGTAMSSVSLSGSTLTINFASRPWGLCVALIHHN